MDPDKLLDEINAISRGGVHRLAPGHEALRQLRTLSHKINQLIDWIECGQPLPAAFTRHREIWDAAAARAAREQAEREGC